jgi:glycerate kinase
MADREEGTVHPLILALDGQLHEKVVIGPLGGEVNAQFAFSLDNSTAMIEMAESSALALVRQEERNPLFTSSYGTGGLIRSALECGVSKVILGFGGSTTNDGDGGMMEALWGRLYNQQSKGFLEEGAR